MAGHFSRFVRGRSLTCPLKLVVYMEGKNILTRVCFMAGIAILACNGVLLAAPPESSAPRVKTVVRADPRTGQLVRVVVSTPHLAAEKTPATAQTASAATFGAIVERVAAEQSVPAELLHSVIQVESNYNPGAVSPKGAQGMMQLMPATARRFGVPNSFDPVENIQGGAKYLKYLLELYKGDYPRALAAYNAGEKAVARYGGIPPYVETRNYVTQVQSRVDARRKMDAAKPATVRVETAPAGVRPKEDDAPRHIQEIVAADGSVRYITQ
jgi:soluble lytic murein transglycosylase-like protein